MQSVNSTDDDLSLHPSQYSDTGDLLDLNNKLDDVSLQFKKMVLEAVKLEKAKMAALHKREIERIESRHEEERNELIRQRDECRRYWYQHKEVNDTQWQSLVHRTESFAYSAASRQHSVWKMCPELQKRAFDNYPYFKTALKRQAFDGWKRWLRSHKMRKTAQKATMKLTSYKSQAAIFSKWKTASMETAAAKREHHLKQTLSIEMMTLTNDKEGELQSLSEQVANLKRQLAIETQHRGALEERLKIAFMRGVCALNLEAMQVMKTEDELTLDEQQQQQQRMREEVVAGDSEIVHSDPVVTMSSAQVKSYVNRSIVSDTREGISISATRQPLVQSVAPGAVSAIIPSNTTAASDRSLDATTTTTPSPTYKSRPLSQQTRRRPLAGATVTRSTHSTGGGVGGIASALSVKELHPVRRHG